MWDWLDATIDFFFNEGADGSGGIVGDVWQGAGEYGSSAWDWLGGSGGSSPGGNVPPPDTNDGSWTDIFSDGDIWAAGITTLPALISGLAAPDPEEQNRITNEQNQQRIDLERDALAQQAELHRQSIEAQMASVDAAREAATKRALMAANQMFSSATSEITKLEQEAIKGTPELNEQANARRIQAAQTTGQLGQAGGASLANTLQSAALSRA